MDIIAKCLASKSESSADLTLSVSKAKTYSDCAAKFKFCYIEKLPRKEWAHHKFGKFLHEALENFQSALLDNAELPIRPLMNKSFNDAIKSFDVTKEQKDEGFKIISQYLKIFEENIKKKTAPTVLAVEKEFYIDLNGKVLLNGFIDLVQKDADGILHVADYKTTKDKRYLKDFFQLLTYAYVLMLEDENISHIRASYILLRHNCEYITKEYSKKEVMKISEEFIKYAEKIEAERLWRASPTRLCSYCDYLDHCPEGTAFLNKIGVLKPKFGFTTNG